MIIKYECGIIDYIFGKNGQNKEDMEKLKNHIRCSVLDLFEEVLIKVVEGL